MLLKVHKSHQGIVRSKQRAREVLYWPGMCAEIEEMISRCDICNTHARKQQRQPLLSHDVPLQPWNKVACDLFVFENEQYCLVTDYYSKYPEVINLGRNSTSHAVVKALKSVFSRHGIPQTLVSDNGPCYASHEFRKFVQEWEFTHVTSSPLYPRSNGMAERNVQTMKSIMKKSKDPYFALLEYRTTPIDGIGLSPAQMLMGRRLNSKIPTHKALLNTESVNSKYVIKRLQERQRTDAKYYNRGTYGHRALHSGEGVRVWNSNEELWKPAIVEKEAKEPRSYIVRTEDGSRYRRNRQDIRVSPEVGSLPEPEFVIDHSDQSEPIPNPRVSHQSERIVAGTGKPKSIVRSGAEPQSIVEPRRSKRVRFAPSKYNEYVMS